MKYLKSKLIITILLFVSICGYGQDDAEYSKLKDFEGIWKFTPPQGSNDTTFINYSLIKDNKLISVTYWKDSKEISVLGKQAAIIGFNDTPDKNITKLSHLKDKGQHLCFYENNPNAPNDSIKYYRESRPTCFASYNGIGTDSYLGYEMEFPKNGEADYFIFNFNGRDNDFYRKVTHLPNFIIQLLLQDSVEWEKLRPFLYYDYKMIQYSRAIIYKSINNNPTNMYLIKNDVVQVLEEQEDWLRIRYYGKKVIEGWIKKSDVE